MKKKLLSWMVAGTIILFSVSAFADGEVIKGVRLMNDSVVLGKVIEVNPDKVVIEKKDKGTVTIKFSDVKAFIFTKEEGAAGAAVTSLVESPYSRKQKEPREEEIAASEVNFTTFARHIFEIGPEVSHIEYKEPGVMKNTGIMYGVGMAYSYHNGIMFGLNTRLAFGKIDYSSTGTGTINGVNDYLGEIRTVIGYDFKPARSTVITPYIGLGYWYLRDEMNGKISSTGSAGYLRESNYLYSPVGLTVTRAFGNSWSVGMTMEFDVFWQGLQKSRLSDVDPGYNDLENKQNSGYGLRGSVQIKKVMETISLAVEPYAIYWDIKQSETQLLSLNGIPAAYMVEPNNNTTEIGIRFKIMF